MVRRCEIESLPVCKLVQLLICCSSVAQLCSVQQGRSRATMYQLAVNAPHSWYFKGKEVRDALMCSCMTNFSPSLLLCHDSKVVDTWSGAQDLCFLADMESTGECKPEHCIRFSFANSFPSFRILSIEHFSHCTGQSHDFKTMNALRMNRFCTSMQQPKMDCPE